MKQIPLSRFMKCEVLPILAGTALFFGLTASASAGVIWENSAGSDMGAFDSTTGTQTVTLTQDKGNGRGIVVVGDTVYYTVANSGDVYARSATTNADLGVAFTIAGAAGLQCISFDGTNFWVGDYSGTTRAYYVAPDGTLLNTITLDPTITNIEGYYDGLEYFNGMLIANRYDGGYARAGGNQYSIYNLDGSLVQANFIDTNGHGNGTGIAFDGTNFYIADIFNNRITVWDGTTGAYLSAINLSGSHVSMEDLSVDFAAREDTCGGPDQPPCEVDVVPEPGILALLGFGFAGIAGFRRRKA